MKPEFISNLLAHLLGNKQVSFYAAAMIFSSLGIMVSIYYSSTKRDKDNPFTPDKFSLLFLMWDNMKRFFVGCIVLFLLFRFTPEMSMLMSVGLGVVIAVAMDRLIEYLINFTNAGKFLKMPRENFPTIPANTDTK